MTTTTSTYNNMDNDSLLTDQHVYTPRNFYRYLGLGVAIGAFIVVSLALATKRTFPSTYTIIALFVFCIIIGAGITLITRFALRNMRLITSDEGIVFYGQGGYRLYTPWNNIKGRSVWSTGRGSITAIRLRTPAQEMSLAEGIQQQQPAIEKRGWLNKMDTMHQTENLIPIGYFLSNWQHSPLALDIKQHTPDVDWNKRIVIG